MKQHTMGAMNAQRLCGRASSGNEDQTARALSGRRSSKTRLNLSRSRSHSLQRYCALVAIAGWLALMSSPVALANCKDEVQHLRNDINNEPNPYTVESREQAQKELAKADAALLRAECREYLDRARQALKKK